MAGLKKKRNYWYAVINRWDGVKNREQYIRLSKNKVEARVRHAQVEKVEKDIKNGYHFDFAWLNEDCITKIEILTLEQVVNRYLEYRKNAVRDSTLKRDEVSLKNLMFYMGNRVPIKSLDKIFVTGYIAKLKIKNYKPAGININLAHIRTFFNWLLEMDYIDKQIKIKKIDVGKSLPKYLNENQINDIYKLQNLSNYFKNAFYFYERTGCRTREPFVGKLNGNWLIVDSDFSKTKIDRQIELTEELSQILKSMHKYRNDYLDDGCKLKSVINRHTKIFKKSLQDIEIYDDNFSLKSLRHTYAVRRYLETRDIYKVKNELGHTRVSTTEVYAKFILERLKDDFPSFKKVANKSIKLSKNAISGTLFSGTMAREYSIPFR